MQMTRGRRLLAALTATAAAVLTGSMLAGSPAWAHNSLTDASPAKNATLKEAPEQVKLTFLQRVDPKALSIAVTDPQRRPVPADDPKADGKVGSLAFREPLSNGVYTVTYRVVSLDGHPVEGAYKFTVDDPSAPSSATPDTPSAAPPSAAAAAAAPETVPASAESDGPGWWPLGAGLAVVALLAAGAFFAMRRRQTR